MKLKAIASMCKSAKSIIVKNVVNGDGEISQWVGIGSALYRLEGLPYLNETAIYRVFDIPESKTEDFVFCEETIDRASEMYPFFIDFAEGDAEGTNDLTRSSIDLQMNLASYVLYCFQNRYIFVDADVLAPAQGMDCRSLVFRQGAIVVKTGLMAEALIFPVPAWQNKELRLSLRHIYDSLTFEKEEKEASDLSSGNDKVLNLFNRVVSLPPKQQQIVFDAVMDGIPEGKQKTEQRCRVCGCTEFHACMTDDGPCHWVAPDLCSACEGKTDLTPKHKKIKETKK